jgi:SAM-dependent methyltransferase
LDLADLVRVGDDREAAQKAAWQKAACMTIPGFYPATLMPDADWWSALWPSPGNVLTALGLAPGLELVVDLCCGDGLFTTQLCRLARRVIAIDIDPEMIERARTRLVATAHCAFVIGDAYRVAEMVESRADAVFLANTFHGVPDKPRLARAVAAITKPSGRFIVVNWHRRPRGETTVLGAPRGPKTGLRMEPADVAAEVEPAGFTLSDVVELPPYHYGAVLLRC